MANPRGSIRDIRARFEANVLRDANKGDELKKASEADVKKRIPEGLVKNRLAAFQGAVKILLSPARAAQIEKEYDTKIPVPKDLSLVRGELREALFSKFSLGKLDSKELEYAIRAYGEYQKFVLGLSDEEIASELRDLQELALSKSKVDVSAVDSVNPESSYAHAAAPLQENVEVAEVQASIAAPVVQDEKQRELELNAKVYPVNTFIKDGVTYLYSDCDKIAEFFVSAMEENAIRKIYLRNLQVREDAAAISCILKPLENLETQASRLELAKRIVGQIHKLTKRTKSAVISNKLSTLRFSLKALIELDIQMLSAKLEIQLSKGAKYKNHRSMFAVFTPKNKMTTTEKLVKETQDFIEKYAPNLQIGMQAK